MFVLPFGPRAFLYHIQIEPASEHSKDNNETFTMKSFLTLVLIFAILSSLHAESSVQELCNVCGDIINEYCCKYYNNCCDCEYLFEIYT